MKFSPGTPGPSTVSRPARPARRPSRAWRPGLDLERFEQRTLLSVALVSVNSAGTGSANGASDFQSVDISSGAYAPVPSAQTNLSGDGARLVFASEATNLVSSLNDTNRASDVFLRDVKTGTASLVSVTPDGQSGNGPSFNPMISPNGRYVAFVSLATNLSTITAPSMATPGGQGVGYLYVRDLQTKTTTLLEQTPAGQAADGWSTGQFVFSPDSTKLAFTDTSGNLTTAAVESGANSSSSGQPDPWNGSPTYVYVRNLTAQTTSLVSVSTGGLASGDYPLAAVVGSPPSLVWSPDSQSLVFSSSAADLTANAPDSVSNPNQPPAGVPGSENLFLRDLSAGTTTLLSVTTKGRLAAGDSLSAVFSPDGKSVAFASGAADLTANAVDTTPPPAGLGGSAPIYTNIFVRNLATGTTSLVSATPGGLQSNGIASQPVFSPDGRSLAFLTLGNDLTSNPLDPTPPPGSSVFGMITGAPTTPADNLFLTNLATGTTTLVSVTPTGMMSSGMVGQVLFSPDGKSLAFTSSAGDLTNNPLQSSPPVTPGFPAAGPNGMPSLMNNAFVRNLAALTTTLASATTSGQVSNGFAGGLIFSPDSRLLFFTSSAGDLTSNPAAATSSPVGTSNLFVRDLAAAATSLISATTSGQLSDNLGPASAFLSPDGKMLYFESGASLLTTGDSNGSNDIFTASAPFTAPTASLPPRSTSPVAATPEPGPAVVGLTSLGSRRGVTSVVITFNQALDPASAQNLANYQITLPGRTVHTRHGHLTTTRPGRSVVIKNAGYNATTHQVTLNLRTPLRRGAAYQFRVNGASASGVESMSGASLNSPDKLKPGRDYQAVLDLATPRP
jgi:Tol biopolymer transport system component